jgi:uncharacterized protein DUF2490
MRTGVFIILLTALGAPATAQTIVDHRAWASAVFQGHFQPHSRWRWSVETTLRSKNGVDDLDVLVAPRAAVGYDLTPKFSAWISYAEIMKFAGEGARQHEHRFVEQFIWTSPAAAGTMALRTRIEERDVDGNNRVALRLREQVRYTHPLSAKNPFSIVSYDEIMFHANATAKYQRGFDQNRAFAGVGVTIGSHGRLEVGYLNHYGRSVGQPNFVNHVLSTTLNVTF